MQDQQFEKVATIVKCKTLIFLYDPVDKLHSLAMELEVAGHEIAVTTAGECPDVEMHMRAVLSGGSFAAEQLGFEVLANYRAGSMEEASLAVANIQGKQPS